MRDYELYLVLDAEAEEDAVSNTVDRMTSIITNGHEEMHGEVIKVDDRGNRRLVYAIKRKQEGHDILFTFHAPPQVLNEMERVLKLDESVLRYLLVRTDQ